MARRFAINVTGSALVYFKRDAWNIVFITEDCHLAKFRNPLNQDRWEVLASPNFDRVIQFRSSDATQSSGFTAEEKAKFLNLYHRELHGPANGTKGDLRVKPNMKDGRKYVLMQIPYGTIRQTGALSSDIDYSFYPIGASGRLAAGFAKQFSIEFDVNDDLGLEMSFHDPFGARPYLFPSTGDALTLAFDNYCEDGPDYNDFIHYYDWVQDINTTSFGLKRRFVTKENPPTRVLPPTPMGLEVDPKKMGPDLDILGRDGDCDPVIIDPPPGDWPD